MNITITADNAEEIMELIRQLSSDESDRNTCYPSTSTVKADNEFDEVFSGFNSMFTKVAQEQTNELLSLRKQVISDREIFEAKLKGAEERMLSVLDNYQDVCVELNNLRKQVQVELETKEKLINTQSELDAAKIYIDCLEMKRDGLFIQKFNHPAGYTFDPNHTITIDGYKYTITGTFQPK